MWVLGEGTEESPPQTRPKTSIIRAVPKVLSPNPGKGHKDMGVALGICGVWHPNPPKIQGVPKAPRGFPKSATPIPGGDRGIGAGHYHWDVGAGEELKKPPQTLETAHTTALKHRQ